MMEFGFLLRVFSLCGLKRGESMPIMSLGSGDVIALRRWGWNGNWDVQW